jgi:subtilisin family serine protease
VHRVLVLALLAGCYNPTVAVGGPCSDQGFCPSAQMCIAGHCVVNPPEVDSSIDTPLIDTPDVDASIDGPPIDAPPDAFVSPTWLTPTLVPGVNTTADEGDPCFTPDRLTIVFARNDDLFLGTRPNTGAAFTVAALTTLNTTSVETSPEISSDGLTLYFASERLSLGNADIYRSTFSGGAWSAPVLVTELNTSGNEGDLAISPDGLTMFLARGTTLLKSTRPTTTSVWSAPATTGTVWGTDAAAPAINGAGDVYLQDGQPRDLLVSRRGSLGNYPTPVAITELNTSTRDAGPWVSADDLYLAFEHDGEIYETHR